MPYRRRGSEVSNSSAELDRLLASRSLTLWSGRIVKTPRGYTRGDLEGSLAGATGRIARSQVLSEVVVSRPRQKGAEFYLCASECRLNTTLRRGLRGAVGSDLVGVRGNPQIRFRRSRARGELRLRIFIRERWH